MVDGKGIKLSYSFAGQRIKGKSSGFLSVSAARVVTITVQGTSGGNGRACPDSSGQGSLDER